MTVDNAHTRRKWRRWITNIRTRSESLAAEDAIFRRIMQSAHSAEVQPNNQAYQWMMRVYWQFSLLGLRKLTDRDQRTYSIRVLLQQIAGKPDVLTRRSFVSLYPLSLRRDGIADKHFDNLVGSGENHVPKHLPVSDLDKICKISNRFSRIQNKYIAHFDRDLVRIPRHAWNEIHCSIESIEEISHRWELLLSATACPPMRNEIADFFDADFNKLWAAS